MLIVVWTLALLALLGSYLIAAGRDCIGEGGVVLLVHVRIRRGEVGHRAVEGVALAEIRGKRDAVGFRSTDFSR